MNRIKLIPALLLLAACEPADLSKYADDGQGQLTSLSNLVLDDHFTLTDQVDDWRDEVIYQVIIDRFADGDLSNNYNVNKDALAQYHGGDWQGLIDHLWYLKELGVTALWISPVVTNVENDAGFAGYHGYWTQNFLKPNPHFGDLAKLRELVDAAHAQGLKVILDLVTNHIGQLFFYDINGNGWADEATYGCGNSDLCDSKVQHVIEYDPDYDSRGIQGYTSLGESGPASIIWIHDPTWNHMPILPREFQNPSWYNKRGRVWVWRDWNGSTPDFSTVREQEVKGDFPGGLKDLDTSLTEVQDALIKVFQYWIRVGDFDGFRIDTLKHVEHAFWERFCPAMRDYAQAHGKQRFFQFGEAFDGSDELIGSYTRKTREIRDDQGKLLRYEQVPCTEEVDGGQVVKEECANAPWIDSVFYFSHKFTVFENVFKWGAPTKGVENLFNQRALNFGALPAANGPGLPPQRVLVNFMSNHDIPRFLYDKPSVPALWTAFTHLLTMDGIPCIYYGEEQEFTGGNDPANREDMAFETNGLTFRYVKGLIALRKQYDALRRGEFVIRWTSDRWQGEEDAGILAFERACQGSEWSQQCQGPNVLVVINAHDGHDSRTAFGGSGMATSFTAGTVLKDVTPGSAGGLETVGADGKLTVTLPPRGVKILVPQ
jgi:glycosidase